MAEYIEKEKTSLILREEAAAHYPTAFHVGLYAAARAIDSIPAADVRPVVLCRDCKHWDIDWVPNYAKENEHFCPIITLTTRDDWFCADGEKREES